MAATSGWGERLVCFRLKLHQFHTPPPPPNTPIMSYLAALVVLTWQARHFVLTFGMCVQSSVG